MSIHVLRSLFTGHPMDAWHNLTNALDQHGNTANLPGVGGPAKDPTQLRQDPTTGAFFDPTTGTTYTDATGQTPVAAPGLAQQTASNFGVRNAFLNKVPGQDATMDQVNGQQTQLANNLKDTINGRGTSVAQTQLAQTTDANGRQIMGTAAGVGGNNAYDARRQAVMALAGANTGAAGNAALLRAKEVSDAQGQLGSVLNQQGSAAQTRQNTNITAGSDFSKQAENSKEAEDKINAGIAESNRSNNQKWAGAGFKGLSGAAGMGGG